MSGPSPIESSGTSDNGPPFSWRWFLPRPAEWVVLGFWGYVTVRLAVHGDLESSIELVVFRPEIFGALLLVLLVLSLRDFVRRPWPEGRTRFQKWHRLSLLVAGLPLMLSLLAYLTSLPRAIRAHDPLTAEEISVMLYSITALTLVVLAGGLPLLLWAAVGQNGKQASIDPPGRFARRQAFRAIDALRDWLPPALLVFGYSVMQQVLDIPLWRDLDPEMAAIDRFLFFGHDPVRALQAIIWAPLSEWLAFCYAFYAALFPLVFGIVRATGGVRALRELALAITLCMGIGLITYSLVPVVGPMFFTPFEVPIDAHYVQSLKEALMDRTRIPRDCFPSLHTANTLLLCWAVFRYSRRWFWLLLPFAASIPFACVYLRYHYVIDVLAGAALAAGVVALVKRILRPAPGAAPPLTGTGANGKP